MINITIFYKFIDVSKSIFYLIARTVKISLIYALLFFFMPSIGLSQIPDDIPEFVDHIFFFDPTNSNPGDGTLENPWNDFSVIPTTYVNIHGSWTYDNSALLFKRGTVMWRDDPRRAQQYVDSDSTYFGAYGTGPIPEFMFDQEYPTSRNIIVRGRENKVSHIKIHNGGLLFHWSGEMEDKGEYSRCYADSVVTTGGIGGISAAYMHLVHFDNCEVSNVYLDGMYFMYVDSVIVRNTHIYDVNIEYVWKPGIAQAGGDCIQVEGIKEHPIQYALIENCILDKRIYGGKFNLIANWTREVIVRDTKFYIHPEGIGIYGRNFSVERCYFQGGHNAMNVRNDFDTNLTLNRVYNSIFIGMGRDFQYTNNRGATSEMGALLDGTFADIYNNTFINHRQMFSWPNRNLNVRNNIFYNIESAYGQVGRNVHGSGNIHYNPDNTQQGGMSKYEWENETYIDKDPLFILLDMTWEEKEETLGPEDDPKGKLPQNHNGRWTWWDLVTPLESQDLRVQENSPAIDAADERVYDSGLTFIFGESNFDDPVYERRYTEYQIITTDYDGNERPAGSGYDIGAYEHGSVNYVPGIRNNSLSLFPNPARHFINVQLTDVSFSEFNNISVFNMAGTMVFNKPVTRTHSDSVQIPLSTIPPGIYVLKLDNKKNYVSLSKQFIIQY